MNEKPNREQGAPSKVDILEQQAALYYLGALDEPEKTRFEDLLQRKHPAVQQVVYEMEMVVAGLMSAIPSVDPPLGLKSRLMGTILEEHPHLADSLPLPGMAQVEESPPELPQAPAREGKVIVQAGGNGWKRATWITGIAAAALLAGLLVYTQQLRGKIDALQTRVDFGTQLVQRLKQELDEKKRALAIAQAPALRFIPLKNLDAAPPNARAAILFDPDHKKALISISDLPAAAEGKDYQLWMLEGDKPVDAGLLKVGEDGLATLEVETLAQATPSAFAVTIEPAGGSPEPTGKMLFLGVL